MNYILNENKTQILIEGNWYDIYNDLKKVEPTNPTYIRQNKKNECYEYLLFNVEEIAKKLLNYSKFTNNASYKDLIDRYNSKNNQNNANNNENDKQDNNKSNNSNVDLSSLLNEIANLKELLIDKKVIVKNDGEIYHECFNKVVGCVKNNIPTMLVGPAGTGKNYTLEQVAKSLNKDFYIDNAITQEYKLSGFVDANGIYQESNFYKACTTANENGAIYMLDEMDASSAEALVTLNSAIANGYFTFPNGEKIVFNDKVTFVCGCNTFGLGATTNYSGRNVIDGATLDRFITIKMDYDKRVEEYLCKDKELLEFIRAIRDIINKKELNYIVGMRACKYAYILLKDNFSKEDIIEMVIIKGMDYDSIQEIKRELYYKDNDNYKEWYDIFYNKMYK